MIKISKSAIHIGLYNCADVDLQKDMISYWRLFWIRIGVWTYEHDRRFWITFLNFAIELELWCRRSASIGVGDLQSCCCPISLSCWYLIKMFLDLAGCRRACPGHQQRTSSAPHLSNPLLCISTVQLCVYWHFNFFERGQWTSLSTNLRKLIPFGQFVFFYSGVQFICTWKFTIAMCKNCSGDNTLTKCSSLLIYWQVQFIKPSGGHTESGCRRSYPRGTERLLSFHTRHVLSWFPVAKCPTTRAPSRCKWVIEVTLRTSELDHIKPQSLDGEILWKQK
jgi:uncharacterized membrane protein SirB2